MKTSKNKEFIEKSTSKNRKQINESSRLRNDDISKTVKISKTIRNTYKIDLKIFKEECFEYYNSHLDSIQKSYESRKKQNDEKPMKLKKIDKIEDFSYQKTADIFEGLLSKQRIYYIFKEGRSISKEDLNIIVNKLDISEDYLLGKTDIPYRYKDHSSWSYRGNVYEDNEIVELEYQEIKDANKKEYAPILLFAKSLGYHFIECEAGYKLKISSEVKNLLMEKVGIPESEKYLYNYDSSKYAEKTHIFIDESKNNVPLPKPISEMTEEEKEEYSQKYLIRKPILEMTEEEIEEYSKKYKDIHKDDEGFVMLSSIEFEYLMMQLKSISKLMESTLLNYCVSDTRSTLRNAINNKSIIL